MEREQTVADLGEWGVLRRLRERLLANGAAPDVLVDVGDDAAVVRGSSNDTILTCDTLIEGVHFRLDWSAPADVGWKSLACSISDICAMGGVARYALVGLGLPRDFPVSSLDGLYAGLLECGNVFATRLVGGDVVLCDRLLLAVTVVGQLEQGSPLRIDGARPGDGVFVSGPLGAAELGARLLADGGKRNAYGEACVAAHRRPWPRADLVQALRAAEPTAATDCSDGLARDLRKICEASRVGATVDVDRIPTSRAAFDAAGRLELDLQLLAAGAGDDLQLLFTLPDGRTPPKGCRRIGQITAERDIRFTRNGESVKLPSDGYDHFGNSTAT